jgi:hypothetical protein
MAFEPDRPRCHHVRSVSGQEQNEIEDAEVVGEPTRSPPDAELEDDEIEVVDGLPVIAEVRTVQAASPVVVPAVQTAAAVATGFVAGAATIALFRRLGGRRLARTRVTPRRGAEGLPIIGSRSFLVDVHLIAKPGE